MKDYKMVGALILSLIVGFYVVTHLLDWYQSRQNQTDASNTTAGTTNAFGTTGYGDLKF